MMSHAESFDSFISGLNIEKKRFITIGKCSRYYLFILGSAIFKFLSLILLGMKNVTKNGFGLFGFCPTFNDFNFIQSIFIYFGYLVFGILFLFFKDIKKLELNELVAKSTTITRTFMTNRLPKENPKISKLKLFLLGLAFVLYIEVKKVLYIEGFQFFNFWTVEIIFMIHFMRKYFVMDFYLHNKVSIIFIISICSILLLTASFLPTSLLGKISGNAYENIEIKLGSKFYSILFIFIFIILSYDYSFSRIYSKILMQIKFISPYKIILAFGIVGFVISLIASIVSYFIGYRDNFNNYFSSMRNVLNGGKPYKFWVEIFCIYPLYSFTNFMELTFEILTIYYLNPFYVLMTNNLYYSITELISFLSNISSDGLKIAHFFIAEFSEFFAFLGYMVYLEILELNFCRLNENLKRIIIAKGEKEFRHLALAINKDNDFESEEDEKDEEYTAPYRNI